jgi:hypothetical protein
MPLKYFKCKNENGELIAVSSCLGHCDNRCLSLPTLTSIGAVRKWNGTPSTTQLLNPTRLEFLQLTHDFAVDPFNQAFALLGTRHHGKLEAVAKKIEGLEAELKLRGEISGILDLLEPINGNDLYRLTDYKTYGSYAAAKHIFKGKGSEPDVRKLALQTNNYRVMADDVGFHVIELFVQITVRDGGTFSARNNKVTENIYFLPVEILPDNEVREYFSHKKEALLKALETNTMPELCEYDERWGSKRCKGYCSVSKFCPEGAMINKEEYKGS